MWVADDDPHLWLEDITGDDALEWVRAHNDPTLEALGGERFETIRGELLEVLDTDARIPYVRRRGEYLYNFWRDEANPKGVWRRTTLESYRTDEPEWDVIIDVDELAREDGENWVWSGAEVIEPEYTLALISLSRGVPTPWSHANSTCEQGHSSPTGSTCPKRSPRRPGRTRTPCWCAPISVPVR